MHCRYNTENGGPALEKLTNAIHDRSTKIKQYYISDDDLLLDYSKTGTTQYLVQIHGSSKFRPFTVQVSGHYLVIDCSITSTCVLTHSVGSHIFVCVADI